MIPYHTSTRRLGHNVSETQRDVDDIISTSPSGITLVITHVLSIIMCNH